MKFHDTPLAGAHVVELDKLEDPRGFFARAFCAREFGAKGLETGFVQVNTALSRHRGTLRGMHFQLPPAAEVKLIRCIRGALFDVVVDLRPDSPTFKKWYGATLSAENRLMMYCPRGFAHGLLTLEDETEAFYLVSNFYSPECERGLRFDDPSIGIEWPFAPVEVSEKDKSWPLYDPAFHGAEALTGLR